jgi:radical SAM superfamily enzyme YgiQ (UPF0313 family)
MVFPAGEQKRASILFITPSLGTESFTREDVFRSYLSTGALASALGDRKFVASYAALLNGDLGEGCLPEFEIRSALLSRKPRNQSPHRYLEELLLQAKSPPDLVCVTSTSAQLDEAQEVAAAAAVLAPESLRVIGGAHVSVLPEDFLRQSDFHVACIGEGVETLVDLAISFAHSGSSNLARICGIAYKDANGAIRQTRPRQHLLTLDDYPFPSDSLDLFTPDIDDREQNGHDLVYILAGFGCPYRCSFCAQHAIHQGKIRERSADSIFAEVRKLHARGFRRFALVQETFLNGRARVERFCDLINASGLPVEWTVEARADQVDESLLRKMRMAGLRFIQIGVESGDSELLKSIDKKVNLPRVRQLRDLCADLKIDTAYYFLVGLPGQDWQSILRSAVFLRDYPPLNRITSHVSVSVAIPYPGTRIAEQESVRLLHSAGSRSWPWRGHVVSVDERGALLGENCTETDAMVSEEILESAVYLDDFGYFLLQKLYGSELTPEDRMRAAEYAACMLAQIERRTMRDLVLRAQQELSPEDYRRRRAELIGREGDEEALLSNALHAPICSSTTDFLCQVRFENGWQTMKRLRPAARRKWMRLCALAWDSIGRACSRLRFAQDGESTGEKLEQSLDSSGEGAPELVPSRGSVAACGFEFRVDGRKLLIGRL